jgi:hypothetical protein
MPWHHGTLQTKLQTENLAKNPKSQRPKECSKREVFKQKKRKRKKKKHKKGEKTRRRSDPSSLGTVSDPPAGFCCSCVPGQRRDEKI